MRLRFTLWVVVPLLTSQTLIPAIYARQATATTDSRATFVRVYPLETQGLTKPVTIRLGRMQADQELSEVAAKIELEITIGVDGAPRDAMVKKSSGGARVEADAIRAVFNSYFRAGTLDGKPVAVRMPLNLTVPGR